MRGVAVIPRDSGDLARADLVQSFHRRRWTAVLSFTVIAVILVALSAASPALGWGFTLALVASYGATTAVGQVLLLRLERRLRGGMRLEVVEQQYRRTTAVNNVVLIVLFIILLLALRRF